MSSTLVAQVMTALAEFSGQTRLYEFRLSGSDAGVVVEASYHNEKSPPATLACAETE